MTGRERQRPSGDAPSTVTAPEWEAELRAALETEGGSGSVEPELAIARLLAHAGRVEELDARAESRIWSDVERGIAPTPWWRRRWIAIAAPAGLAAAAAAVLVIVIAQPDRGRKSDRVATSADLLEQQFELLAPSARAEVSRTVDAGRGELRSDLIAMAMASDGRTHGGAP
ncbi:MAG TPA: hypothetical protein VFG69_21060 [Nannocystaceae bacterium]|nr:hypothetical protein [Nannocystaceae bacterium]